MSVWGFYASNGTTYKYDTPYLDGVTFKYSTTDEVWKGYSNDNFAPYYWPYSGSMQFIAVYPTSAGTSVSKVFTAAASGSPATWATTINDVDLSTAQPDIIYSNNLLAEPVNCAGMLSEEADSPKLTFDHLLSQVVVNVRPEVGGRIKLTEVKLINVTVKGDITITESFITESSGSTIARGVIYPIPNYTTRANIGEVSYTLRSDVKQEMSIPAEDDEYHAVSSDGALVIPIPRDLIPTTGDVKPQISITYGSDYGDSITKYIDLGVMKAGMKYIYNVTIGLKEITFITDVTSWNVDINSTPSNFADDKIDKTI